MTKICVLGGHNHMQRLVSRENIEFHELYDPDPFNISIPQWGKEYTDFVNSINPDYIICIAIRCASIACNNWIKSCRKPQQKYVMWNFDSYRHHDVKHNNADLYYYCLNDAVKKPDDLFLPVFAQPRPLLELTQRPCKFGIVCHHYDGLPNRTIELRQIINILNQNSKIPLWTHHKIPPHQYYETIGQFKCGLNLAVHPDGLPNMRTFEYPACGVWQICSTYNKNILDKLFDYGISYYNDIKEIPDILRNIPLYDPTVLQKHVAKNHTLLHRIKEIMFKFNVDIPLVAEDEKMWTYNDYLQRHGKT